MNSEVPVNEWLLHVASKGAVVLGVALLAGLLLRRMAAARRYAVWISAMGALALLPLAVWGLPAWRVLHVHAEPQVQILPLELAEEEVPPPELLASAPAASVPATVIHRTSPLSAAVPPVLAVPPPAWEMPWHLWPALWLAGTGWMLLRLVRGAWHLRRLEQSLLAEPCALLADVAREMGLRRVPRLLVGAADAVPMVWGVWQPRLLLPRGFETWGADKLRGVLLHELAHLRRRDPLALWAAQWVKALHWPNPLAWLTLRELRADQERACDDVVLRHAVRPSEYAQHLLDLSRNTRVAPGLALCALTITRCAPVEARVKAILDPNRARDGITRRWLAGLAGFALLTTLPVAMLHAIEGAKRRGRLLDRHGLVLAESTEKQARRYPLKALAGHVTGYTRLREKDDPMIIGGAALEKTHDATLQAGQDLTLSLDARIQALTLRAMRDAGYERGAAVVLDPRTGEILAAVSLPVYDPNHFVPAISLERFDALRANIDAPLLDRAVAGRFTPGAAFMPLTALAGIAAGVGDKKFECTGSVTYSNRVYQCWKWRQNETGHGQLGMQDALVHSCSCYWYRFGNEAGIDAISKMGHTLGFDESFEVIHGESAGILPTPQWMAQEHPKERWSLGYTANLAIGQGALTTSPLHMAVLAATVAQHGKVPQPTFVRIQPGEAAKLRADLVAEGLSAGQIEQVREGMRRVVNQDGGTGKAARSDKVVISGKTGTAQHWRSLDGKRVDDNRAWFIGFAPYDKPTLAFAILKEGGKSGGGDCAPLAKRIVEDTLALPADGSGAVQPVEGPEPPKADKTAAQGDKAAEIDRVVELSRALDQAQTAMADGLTIQERKVEPARVTIQGEALNLSLALQFCDKLNELGKRWDMTWVLPAPKPSQDGKRMVFRTVGTFQSASAGKSTGTAATNRAKQVNAQIQEQLDKAQNVYRRVQEIEVQLQGIQMDVSDLETAEGLFRELRELIAQKNPLPVGAEFVARAQLPPAEVQQWQSLQKDGALADLPAEAQVKLLAPGDTQDGGKFGASRRSLRFSAARAEVRAWLLASLPAKHQAAYATMLVWPEAPQPFERYYPAGGDCRIILYSLDGKTIHVTVERYRRGLYLTPIDTTPPKPKTAAPKELDGVVSADLDARLFCLLPKPTKGSETRLPAFPRYLPSNNLRDPWTPATATPVWLNDPVPLNIEIVEAPRPELDEVRAAMEQHRAKKIDVTLLTNTLPPGR